MKQHFENGIRQLVKQSAERSQALRLAAAAYGNDMYERLFSGEKPVDKGLTACLFREVSRKEKSLSCALTAKRRAEMLHVRRKSSAVVSDLFGNRGFGSPIDLVSYDSSTGRLALFGFFPRGGHMSVKRYVLSLVDAMLRGKTARKKSFALMEEPFDRNPYSGQPLRYLGAFCPSHGGDRCGSDKYYSLTEDGFLNLDGERASEQEVRNMMTLDDPALLERFPRAGAKAKADGFLVPNDDCYALREYAKRYAPSPRWGTVLSDIDFVHVEKGKKDGKPCLYLTLCEMKRNNAVRLGKGQSILFALLLNALKKGEGTKDPVSGLPLYLSPETVEVAYISHRSPEGFPAKEKTEYCLLNGFRLLSVFYRDGGIVASFLDARTTGGKQFGTYRMEICGSFPAENPLYRDLERAAFDSLSENFEFLREVNPVKCRGGRIFRYEIGQEIMSYLQIAEQELEEAFGNRDGDKGDRSCDRAA